MNKNSIKSLVLGFIALFTTISAIAGSGTQGDPFKVCSEAGFKLTSNLTVPSGQTYTYQWFTQSGAAISGQTGVSMSLPTLSTSSVKDTVFKVVAYNAQSCPSDTGSIYVKLVPKPTDTAIVDNSAFCSAQAAATTLNLNGHVATNPSIPSGVTFTYAWSSTASTINNPTQLAATTTPPTAAGDYVYNLKVNYSGLDAYPASGGACEVSSDVHVTVSQTPSTPGATISEL